MLEATANKWVTRLEVTVLPLATTIKTMSSGPGENFQLVKHITHRIEGTVYTVIKSNTTCYDPIYGKKLAFYEFL